MAAPSFFSTTKLFKHLDRVVEWRETGDTRPVMIGLDLTNLCNHRCPQCNGAPGVLGKDKATITFDDLERLAEQFAGIGVKAVSLGGGGDASCHPRLAEVLRLFKRHGIETALFTNAQLVRDDVAEAVVECCTWVRFSLDADGPAMYSVTHGMQERDFVRVTENINRTVALKKAKNSDVVIGTSFLIGSHTIDGIYGAAALARDLGVAYIRMRPFFTWDGQLPFSPDEADRVLGELTRASELDTADFKVTYPAARTEWVKGGTPPQSYARCNVHHFTTQVTADLKVYLCCHTKEMEKYLLGDLRTQTLAEIWASDHRRQVYKNIDYKDCAQPCMMSAHNDLLHMIEEPVMHHNFL